jgi:hypothetical protein
MKKILSIIFLSTVASLFILGCVANSPEPEQQETKKPTESRFSYIETGYFPDGSPLEGVQYSVFQDNTTSVKYLYYGVYRQGWSFVNDRKVNYADACVFDSAFCPLFDYKP